MAYLAFLANLTGLTGTPESGGLVNSYRKGTTTRLSVYADEGVTPATNPVVANSLGQITLYYSNTESYTWRATTANEATTLWEAQVVGGIVSYSYLNDGLVVRFEQVATGDGSDTTFVVEDVILTSSHQVMVHIDGIYQGTSLYTVTNDGTDTTITFGTAPPNGSRIELRSNANMGLKGVPGVGLETLGTGWETILEGTADDAATRSALGAAADDFSNVSQAIKPPASNTYTESFDGDSAIAGYTHTKRIASRRSSASATDVADRQFIRTANYTGGTFGFVNSAVKIQATVSSGVTAFEWALLSLLDNYATAGENVAAYVQGNAYTSAGPTFGAVIECADRTTNDDPASGRVSLEVDNWGVGTDASNRRLGVHIVTGKGGLTGDPHEVGVGLWITPQDEDDANGRFKRAVAVDADVDCAFDTASGTMTSGGPAYRMGNGQYFAFSADNSRRLRWQDGVWYWTVSGSDIATLTDGGRMSSAQGFLLPSFLVSTAPSASAIGAGTQIFVTDETGGAVPAFSDGTDWRRVTDRVVIS